MNEIIRTPTRAEGGITSEEKELMRQCSERWIANAFQTSHIQPDKIIPAIERLYMAAGLKKPKVIIVPSPLVMAVAGGLSEAIIDLRKDSATRDATDATRAATYVATDAATDAATRIATYAATRIATDAATDAATRATRDATRAATDAATDAATFKATNVAIYAPAYEATCIAIYSPAYDATCTATRTATHTATCEAILNATNVATCVATYDATCVATEEATANAAHIATDNAHIATYVATHDAIKGRDWIVDICKNFLGKNYSLGLAKIKTWNNACQGGNMWSAFPCWAEACRDILGLTGLGCWEKYQPWEDCAKYGGFRYMHKDFCFVSDLPEILKINDQRQPHCEDGPSHRWRDGWELYHLYGISFEKNEYWKIIKKEITFAEIMQIKSADKRTIALRYCDSNQLFAGTKSQLVGKQSVKGNELWKLPKEAGIFEEDEYFLRMWCPSTKREFIEGVSPEVIKQVGLDADALQAKALGITLEEYLDSNFLET